MRTRKIVRITQVQPKEGRRLALTFDDGTDGVADVSGLLVGPIFEKILASDDAFAEVALDGYGGIAWPNDADLDPWVLFKLTVSEPASF
ncbi:MAG: DUF2442 domain-containing protein [Actinomycetota bacterium]